MILAYDATQTLLAGSKIALTSNKKFSPDDLRQALTQIKGAQAVQGVSGQISFADNNEPANKAVIILSVAQGGYIQMEPGVEDGTFLVVGK